MGLVASKRNFLHHHQQLPKMPRPNLAFGRDLRGFPMYPLSSRLGLQEQTSECQSGLDQTFTEPSSIAPSSQSSAHVVRPQNKRSSSLTLQISSNQLGSPHLVNGHHGTWQHPLQRPSHPSKNHTPWEHPLLPYEFWRLPVSFDSWIHDSSPWISKFHHPTLSSGASQDKIPCRFPSGGSTIKDPSPKFPPLLQDFQDRGIVLTHLKNHQRFFFNVVGVLASSKPPEGCPDPVENDFGGFAGP